MDLRLVTPPAAEPVTLTEAKRHLRVDSDAEDTLITAWIEAARQQVEGETSRALMPQTWELRLPGFPCGGIELPWAPLSEVLEIAYLAPDGALTTLDAAAYQVVAPSGPTALPGAIHPLAVWPVTQRGIAGAVAIRYRVGYPDGAVPGPLRAALLLALGDLYENREAVTERSGSTPRAPSENPTFNRLLAPYRIWSF